MSNIKTITKLVSASVIALSFGLMACQNQIPANQDQTKTTAPAGLGSVGIQFDFGQSLNAADFVAISQLKPTTKGPSASSLKPSTKGPIPSALNGFHILQAVNANFNLNDIDSATITVISPFVANPATAKLTRQDIANGWSFTFGSIPAGDATVLLEVHDAKGNKLFSDRRDVQVAANSVTPVDFTIELAPGQDCCANNNCTGSIKVNVKAVTSCFSKVAVSPVLADVGKPVTIKLSDLQGSPTTFKVDFGDGSPAQDVTAFPITHAYATSGRYPISISLSGGSCSSPITAKSYVTVSSTFATKQVSNCPPPPANTSIVFTSNRDSTFTEIYLMGLDGVSPKRLTTNTVTDTLPSLSRDGKQIVYTSLSGGTTNNAEIFVMDINGANQKNVTNDAIANDIHPTFSPDGTQIAFWSRRNDVNGVYKINVDGSNLVNLTKEMSNAIEPNWSPDGTKIVFNAREANEAYQSIYTMNTDGTNKIKLTNNLSINWAPHWSPDGQKITFTLTIKDGESAIYVMNADGSNQKSLVAPADYSRWLPDGSIIFHSVRDGNSEVYRMNADGSNQTNLTKHPAHDQ